MILAGDIGGTKCNLALFEIQRGQPVAVTEEKFPSRDHASLEAILTQFLARHPAEISHACFGLAGPVKNNSSLLTNLRWTIDAAKIAREFSIPQVALLNDLQANAHGIAALPDSDFVTLNTGTPVADGNQAIISAGTGLGEAGLVWSGARQIAIASEGGNTDFSPRTALDIALLQHLQKPFGQVIWEHVLSGNGQFNIYKFLRDTGRGEEPAWLTKELASGELPAPAVITRAALAKKSPLCEQALDLFATYYGAESANLALKFLATGGVYIGGGIAPKILPKLTDGTFMCGFLGQHRYHDLLAAMPVRVILNDRTALLGAARFAALEAGLLR